MFLKEAKDLGQQKGTSLFGITLRERGLLLWPGDCREILHCHHHQMFLRDSSSRGLVCSKIAQKILLPSGENQALSQIPQIAPDHKKAQKAESRPRIWQSLQKQCTQVALCFWFFWYKNFRRLLPLKTKNLPELSSVKCQK